MAKTSTKTDAFTLLKKDHEAVKKMFKEYEGLGDRAHKTKAELSTRIFDELAVHETIEEEIFYPAVRENATKNGVELLLEAYEEHHVADVIIAELKAISPENEEYDAKMKVLQENIEHHIDEEEDELFPEARKALGDVAEDIGEQMAQRKQELTGESAS
jgi:iron-sulfur cluster repair protein YtfE (RIC family)